MPRRAIDFETVRKLARELGEVDEATTYGSPAIKVRGKLLAWIPPHKSLEPNTLAVRVAIEDRAELVEAAPEIYFFTDHYAKYPAVLVRLANIDRVALKDLLKMAVAFVSRESFKRPGEKRRAASPPQGEALPHKRGKHKVSN